jgi:hypothetical protein
MKTNWLFGIGGQKCASTWLYDVLLDHPQVRLSGSKEIDFFSYHYGRGYQWYERQFEINPGGRVCGEISPSYLIAADVPQRVQAYAPEARILVSLRDPVERAISNHRHEARLGNFDGPNLSFEAGLKNNPLYIEQSRYGTHLRRWLNYFDRSAVLIVFQEDILDDPGRVAQEVYRFLDVDPAHQSKALAARSNESHVYRFDGLERTRRAARYAARRLGADGLWRAAQAGGMQTLYRRLNRRPPEAKIPPVGVETRRYLRRLLEEEISAVEQITGRLLPHWRGDTGAGEQSGAAAPVRTRAAAATT